MGRGSRVTSDESRVAGRESRVKVNTDGIDAEDAEVRQEGELFTTKGT